MNHIGSNRLLLPQIEVDGFTLVELLVAVTVLTILFVFALPSFQDMILNNRVLAQRNALTSSLNYARNTALSQNANVIACPYGGANSTTCGGNWQSGWIVVSQPVTGAPVLLFSNAAGPNDPTLSSTAGTVTFDTRGIATTQSNFKICDQRGGSFAQSVQVLPTGFVQSGATMGSAVWDGTGLGCP